MIAHAIFFYVFSFIAIISAIMVTVSKNTVHSVFFLILDFISISCLFIMIGAEFLGMIMLIVYVGAVAVLFLFVVMMLNVRILELNERIISYVPIAIVIVSIFFLLILSIISNNFLEESNEDNSLLSLFLKNTPNDLNNKQLTYTSFQNLNSYSNLNLIGALLYSDYVYLFLLAGMALLVAMLGSIVLTLNSSNKSKRQDFYLQTNKDIVKAIRHLK